MSDQERIERLEGIVRHLYQALSLSLKTDSMRAWHWRLDAHNELAEVVELLRRDDEPGHPPAPSTVLHEESGSGRDE